MRLLMIGALVVGTALVGPTFARSSAGGDAMKACAAQWSAKKAAGSTGAQTYREFSKQCLAANKAQLPSAPQPAPPIAASTVPTPPSATAVHRSRRTSATTATSSTAAATTAPTGASAKCRDGSFSMSKHHSGTCSHHGGVASWLQS